MITSKWQPSTPIGSVIFDCDGTLSTLEGIDVIAEHNGVGQEVVALTKEAMGRSGMNPDLYKKRLDLVRPTQEQVLALGNEYYANRVEDADHVIRVLKQLQKSIYIVSAGLYPAVKYFGKLLDIPENNIIAVNITFDSQGRYINYDMDSPLAYTKGKRIIVSALKKTNPSIAFIGDGLNDVETLDLVERFIGYGGKFYRENIASRCQFYIRSASLAPVLPLLLTMEEYRCLPVADKAIYEKGVSLIG